MHLKCSLEKCSSVRVPMLFSSIWLHRRAIHCFSFWKIHKKNDSHHIIIKWFFFRSIASQSNRLRFSFSLNFLFSYAIFCFFFTLFTFNRRWSWRKFLVFSVLLFSFLRPDTVRLFFFGRCLITATQKNKNEDVFVGLLFLSCFYWFGWGGFCFNIKRGLRAMAAVVESRWSFHIYLYVVRNSTD